MISNVTQQNIDHYRKTVRGWMPGSTWVENPILIALRLATGGEWDCNRFQVWATGPLVDYKQGFWHAVKQRWDLPPEATAFLDAKSEDVQPFSFAIGFDEQDGE